MVVHKKNKVAVVALSLLMLLAIGCSKELSNENGNPSGLPDGGTDGQGTSAGSLLGAGGACANFVVFGAYGIGLPADTSNYVRVSLNITTPGTFIVSSDTLNGVYFAGSGSTATTGTVTVDLKANGTPAQTGVFAYNVLWKGSNCSFQVNVFTVEPIGTGDYFPLTANSNWTYRNNNPTASDTSRQLSTGKQGVLPPGTTYNLFTTDYGIGVLDSSFYRRAANDYRELADVDVIGVSSGALIEDFIFLKDNQPVGTKWETSLLEGPAASGTGTVKTKRTFEIIEKGTKAAVFQKVYQQVIKIRVQQLVQSGTGSFTTAVTYETWFAKGVGLINLTAAAPIYGYGLIRHQVF